MRKYEFTYWTEYQDEMTDFEVIVEALNIEEAITKFKEQTRVYKRITQIKEI